MRSLVPTQGQLTAAKEFGRLVANSVKAVDIAGEVYKIPRDQSNGKLIRPVGMSDAEWNLCCDAMKPMRSMPGYLSEHFARVSGAMRIIGKVDDDEPPIARFVVKAIKAVQYDIIDVTATEEKPK